MSNFDALEHLNSLEEVLVKEFRLCQNLHALTRDERVALASNDTTGLLSLVERKEALLDELGQMEDTRRMATQVVSDCLGCTIAPPTVATLIPLLDPEFARRFRHLHDGIMALMNDIRDLTHGNQAMAETALERSDALQTFLLSLFETPSGYRPPVVPTFNQPAIAWEVDHAA
jgi:flagellar biosynthesis/type III secretory pathway chaperone